LRHHCSDLTCLEIDFELASKLHQRVSESDVKVFCASATHAPFADGSFSNVVCFTMLHHLSSNLIQDRLFAEAYRILRPGGSFIGTDSMPSVRMSVFHLFDTMVLVDPATLPDRLQGAGFRDVEVESARQRFRFAAWRRDSRSTATIELRSQLPQG
jgi:SAM-dependent methyltransferase